MTPCTELNAPSARIDKAGMCSGFATPRIEGKEGNTNRRLAPRDIWRQCAMVTQPNSNPRSFDCALPSSLARETLPTMNPLLGYVLLGAIAGFASGCFGIGGGAVIVPVLVLLFKVDYHIAVGTSLALILPISLAGSATNFSLGKINWQIFTACAVTGMIGAIVGSMFIQKIPALYAKRSFAVFLVYSAWRLWVK